MRPGLEDGILHQHRVQLRQTEVGDAGIEMMFEMEADVSRSHEEALEERWERRPALRIHMVVFDREVLRDAADAHDHF